MKKNMACSICGEEVMFDGCCFRRTPILCCSQQSVRRRLTHTKRKR